MNRAFIFGIFLGLSVKAFGSDIGVRAQSFGQAFRAVATVLAKNYNPDVPCHRVIRSDGGMGGYNRGGVDTKRSILESEGATL